MKKEKILLIGGGGHCKSVIDVIEQEGIFEIGGIIDQAAAVGSVLLNYDVIGSDADLEELHKEFPHAIVTVGQIESNEIRVGLFNYLKEIGYNMPIIMSPYAYVSKHAYIDEGSIIMHHAIVNSHAKIGKNCIINTKALCEHDSKVGNHTHVSTGAIINGGATVEANSFVGSGAVVVEYTLACGFIKAGSVSR